MPFNNEQERLADPWAKLIPRYYFERYFTHDDYSDAYTAYMQAPLGELLSPEKIASIPENEKRRYWLCVACGHPEISISDLIALSQNIGIETDREQKLLMGIKKEFIVGSIEEYYRKYADIPVNKRVHEDGEPTPADAFELAMETGNLDALKKLYELAPDEMITALNKIDGSFVMRMINDGDKFETLDWLAGKFAVFYFFYWVKIAGPEGINSPEFVVELTHIFEKNMTEKLHSYRAQDSAVSGTKNPEEKAFAFVTLMALVDKGDPESLDDIKMLLNIPWVRSRLFEFDIIGNIKTLREFADNHADKTILNLLPVPVDEATNLIRNGEKKIHFSSCGFGVNEITSIVNAINKKNDCIESIDFSRNQISENEAILLANALSKVPTLKYLNLGDNSFELGQSARLIAAFKNLLENNLALVLKVIWVDGSEDSADIPLYLERNKLHANLDKLAEKFKVSLNFQENVSENKKKITPYFDLNELYNEIIQSKKDIQAFDPEHRLAQRHHDTLNDHWLSLVVLFNLRARDIYHRDTSINGIDRRVLDATNRLESIKDKNSIYYKEASYEIGSYYSECANNAKTEEDRKAFIKTALNFWKVCIYDPEFMVSPAGKDFEMRFAMQVSMMLPSYSIPLADNHERLVSDKVMRELYQVYVERERGPTNFFIEEFKADDALAETVKMAAKDSFILLLNKLSSDISHHPDSRHVSSMTLFALPTAVKEKVVYSQALNLLQDLIEDKKVDKKELMEKIDIVSKSDKFAAPFNQFIDSGQAEWLIGKKPASFSEFAGLLYDKQVPEQSLIKSNIKK